MPHVRPDPAAPGGYLLAGGPAPERTSDWMRALVDLLTYVAVRDSLATATVFSAEPGHDPATVARVTPIVPVIAALTVRDTGLAPTGWLVLHPPGTAPSPDLEEPHAHPVAHGSLLLPGMPEVGLDHRAAWAAVDTTGQVAHMRFSTHAQLTETIDLAVLAAVLLEP